MSSDGPEPYDLGRLQAARYARDLHRTTAHVWRRRSMSRSLLFRSPNRSSRFRNRRAIQPVRLHAAELGLPRWRSSSAVGRRVAVERWRSSDGEKTWLRDRARATSVRVLHPLLEPRVAAAVDVWGSVLPDSASDAGATRNPHALPALRLISQATISAVSLSNKSTGYSPVNCSCW